MTNGGGGRRRMAEGMAAAMLLAMAPAARGAASVSFPEQVTLGNIFVAGERVELMASVSGGDAVQWTVLDFENRPVDSGRSAVADGRVRWAPNVKGLGFYTVKLSVLSGDAEQGAGTTMFAIVPPADISKMPDSPFGIMTHFGKSMPQEIIPLIARAGIATVRDEVEWNGFERQKGVFEERPYLQESFRKLAEWGIEPLLVMAFGNRHHYTGPASVPDHKKAPFDEEGYRAYTRYVLEAIKLHRDQVKAVEIWNEYNGTFCDGPAAKDRPKHYTEMLKHAYTAVKAQYPRLKVIGGALVKIPLPYIEKLFKNGALPYMDGIAVHPYRATPEGVEKELAALVELMKKYNQGRAKPIWVTETGSWRDQSPERATTARYLVRMLTLMLTQPEVERIYWYLMCDFREFKTMGIVHGADDPTGRFTPTMIYPAYANLIHRLYGARPDRREETDLRTRVYRFNRANDAVWVCWTTSGQTKLRLAGDSPMLRVNLVGGEQSLAPEGGSLVVDVDETPFYLIGSKATRVTELPRADRIVADSVEDFSGEQGKKNWSYYFFESDGAGSAPYDPSKVRPMTWAPSRGDWDDCWQGPASYLSINEGAAQPSAAGGKQMWAVRRWTSTITGTAQVRVQASCGAARGDGVDVKLFLDGKELASRHIAPKGSETIELPVAFRLGSKFDVAVTPGPGTDTGFDSTGIRVTILVPADHPQP
jgi:hypothetical protein